LCFLAVLKHNKHLGRGMHREAALVVPGAHLRSLFCGHLAGEGSDDPVIAPHDERQAANDIIDRHQLAAGFLFC
jgi:hypothetical protein